MKNQCSGCKWWRTRVDSSISEVKGNCVYNPPDAQGNFSLSTASDYCSHWVDKEKP